MIKEDITVDDFIDVIEGNRRYIKCLYVYNKVTLQPLRLGMMTGCARVATAALQPASR